MTKFYTMFASFWDDVEMGQSESTKQLDPSWPVGLTFCFPSPCGVRWFSLMSISSVFCIFSRIFFSFAWSSRIHPVRTSFTVSSPQVSCISRTQIQRRPCQYSTSPNRRSRSCSTVTVDAISTADRGKPTRLLNRR